MKTYQKKGYEYFYDRYQKHWVVYPIDAEGSRIEWDIDDNPIEAMYFLNKSDLNYFFNFYKKVWQMTCICENNINIFAKIIKTT